MVFYCCVKGCSNNQMSVPHHTFPKDTVLYQRWIEVVGRPDLIDKPMDAVRKSYRVCEMHFGPESRYIGLWNKSVIRRDAVPTLFLPDTIQRQDVPHQGEGNISGVSQSIDMEVTALVDIASTTSGVTDMENSPRFPQIAPSTSADGVCSDSTRVEVPHPHSDVVPCTSSGITSDTRPPERRGIFAGRSHVRFIAKRSDFRTYGRQLRRLGANVERRIKDLPGRVNKIETILRSTDFLKGLVNKPTFDFIVSQLKGQRVHPQGRRYTMDEKVLFLSLLKQSPKGYKLMRRIFAAPSRGTLNNLLRRIPFCTGINASIMDSMREKVTSMGKLHRYCSIVFDEMALDPMLQYHQSSDLIEGFQDNGQGDRRKLIADKAMVFMARGVCANWKQPLAYYFNEGGMKTDVLVRSIREVVVACQRAGLIVKCIICDQGTSNVAAINRLYSETNEYFARKGEENTLFGVVIGGQEIVPLYDPPHLLKGMRNNFYLKDVRFQWHHGNTEVATWGHIKALYDIDGRKGEDFKLCCKLTEEHIYNTRKMKVSIAAQVLSRNVAAAMTALTEIPNGLPKEAVSTAEFLLFMDKLFDSVNGASIRGKRGKPLRCAVTSTSEHCSFWIEAVKVLRSVSFFKKPQDKVIPPTVNNWVRTLEGFRYLWTTLQKEGVAFLCPRNLNQDCLENFFGSIRSHGARNVSPNAAAFVNSFKALIVNNYFAHRSKSSNCENDNLRALDNLKGFLCTKVTAASSFVSFPLVTIPTYSSQRVSLLRRGILTYVAGFVAKKVLAAVNFCKSCRNDLRRIGSVVDDEVGLSTCGNVGDATTIAEEFVIKHKQYSVNALLTPSTSYNAFFHEAIFVLRNVLPRFCADLHIRKFLEAVLSQNMEHQDLFHCTKHCLKALIVQYISKYYLYVWIRNINKTLKGKVRGEQSPDPMMQYAARKYKKKLK